MQRRMTSGTELKLTLDGHYKPGMPRAHIIGGGGTRGLNGFSEPKSPYLRFINHVQSTKRDHLKHCTILAGGTAQADAGARGFPGQLLRCCFQPANPASGSSCWQPHAFRGTMMYTDPFPSLDHFSIKLLCTSK
eukprot:205093-Pelagomonas_calceolata.AAC.1